MNKTLLEYNFPEDLKYMTPRELELLSYEIREFLIEKVSKTGGHIASNLGVVELSIALHVHYNSPVDKIIWDVGHQSYVHKILTGRADRFDTLRQMGGISGFPKFDESRHDAFDTGHASTSVSAALGMASARDLRGEDYKVVAVIGDGSMTGGIAYEALNNAGCRNTDLTIILNDNNMSISQNVGALSQHLGKLRTSYGYLEFKKQLKKTIKNIPGVGQGLYNGIGNIKDSIKYAVINDAAIFEEMGIKYIGPIDGHNINDLLEVFNIAENIPGPKLIHVITKKGKGYKNAEVNPDRFHGISPFDPETGALKNPDTSFTYSRIFGNKLIQLAGRDPAVVAVCAAMLDGTGLENFNKKYPDRCFDVGIAEGHAVTFAAGLAKAGMKPFVAIYSTFLQRSYDMMMIDVCMQNLPVVFCIDRSGIVGNDGETHHGIYDLSYLNHMPNMTVLCPKDGPELAEMMEYALHVNGPCAIRYPKGIAADLNGSSDRKTLDGSCEVLREGKDVAIWAVGNMTGTALAAADILSDSGIDAGVVNVRFERPFDRLELMKSAEKCNRFVTLEDNVLSGGFGHEFSAELKMSGHEEPRVLNLGWPDKFIEHGSRAQLYRKYELDPAGVAERIKKFVKG